VAKIKLVGIHQTTHTVFDTEDVVIDAIDIIFERITFDDKSRGIEPTEVERPSWLDLRRIETEWNQDDCIVISTTSANITVSCVVIDWHRCKVWGHCLWVSNIRTIDLKSHLRGVSKLFININGVFCDQILDWVVKVKFLCS